MTKNILKFTFGFLAILILGLAIFYLLQYFQYRRSPDYRASRELENLEKRYAEDTYGGTTPEETLQLFIEALKKGDIDLASKYFVLDEQEEWRRNLANIKEKNLTGNMIRDLRKLGSRYPLIEGDDKRFIFEAFNEQNELILQADIARGPNGRWKILDL